MTPSNTEESLVERATRAIKAEIGRQWSATPAPGGPSDAGNWTATGGVLDLEAVARAAIAPMRDRLLELMRQRKAHYERKAEERDPLDEDGLNYRDVYTFAAEAMEATEDAITAMFQAALSEGEG